MTFWLHDGIPGAGPLGAHELDTACWRKRPVILTGEQCAAVDETAGLCGTCGGECPTPQACQLPIARATRPERVRDALRRQRAVTAWLAITLGAVICAASLAGHLHA